MRLISDSGPATPDVGGHEQVADVRVDGLGLADQQQLLGQAADRADRQLAVDEEEWIVGPRRNPGLRGDHEAKAAARAHARRVLNVGRDRRAAAMATELDVGAGAA
jgi:hypothetical protein